MRETATKRASEIERESERESERARERERERESERESERERVRERRRESARKDFKEVPHQNSWTLHAFLYPFYSFWFFFFSAVQFYLSNPTLKTFSTNTKSVAKG